MKTKTLTILILGELVAILCLAVLLIPAFLAGRFLFRPPESRPSMIKGVVIHYQYDRASFFPEDWLKDPYNCDGAQVDLSEAERIVPDIREFTAVYDASMLKRNLSDIYLLGDLQCYGKPYGGTNSTAAVYIHVGSQDQGYSDQFVLSTLHEEFSSVLFRNYAFPARAWTDANAKDFVYSNNAVDVLGQPGLKDDPTEELLNGGFLDRYATTGLENDFNQFAAWLFVRPADLCQYRSKYPAIAKKSALAIEFYQSIDPKIKWTECK